jgi:hypothetical protein
MSFQSDTERHEILFGKVARYIESRPGWRVHKVGIEDFGPVPEVVKHSDLIDVKSIRGRPDGFAVHQPTGAGFLFEVKAPKPTGQHSHALVEVLPICDARLTGADPLYILETRLKGGLVACCFGVDDADWLVLDFGIPQTFFKGREVANRAAGCTLDPADEYKTKILQAFLWMELPDNQHRWKYPQIVRGSGDPYARLHGRELNKLPHWRDGVMARMKRAEADGTHVLDRKSKGAVS